jgi:hypothetical protein
MDAVAAGRDRHVAWLQPLAVFDPAAQIAHFVFQALVCDPLGVVMGEGDRNGEGQDEPGNPDEALDHAALGFTMVKPAIDRACMRALPPPEFAS